MTLTTEELSILSTIYPNFHVKEICEGMASIVFITNLNFVIKKPKNNWGLNGLIREDKFINHLQSAQQNLSLYFPHFSKKFKTEEGYLFIQEKIKGVPIIKNIKEISNNSNNIERLSSILAYLHSLNMEELTGIGFDKRNLWPQEKDLNYIDTPNFVKKIFIKNKIYLDKQDYVFSHFDFQANNILHNDFLINGIIDFGNSAFFDRNIDFAALLLDFSVEFVKNICDAYEQKIKAKTQWDKIQSLALNLAIARDIARHPRKPTFSQTLKILQKTSTL